MMKAKLSDKTLERLKEKRQKLDARIQAAEARFKTTERKKDTRRKILIGSYYLDKAAKENNIAGLFLLMDTYLKREPDRALFGLTSKEEATQET
jgi:large subunit ribosomal protein L7/L12